MRLLRQTFLAYQEGNSDKVYEVDLCEVGVDSYVVNFRYGRRGGSLKEGTKTKSPVNLDKAEKTFEKLVGEKQRKGYATTREVTGDDNAATELVTEEETPVETGPRLTWASVWEGETASGVADSATESSLPEVLFDEKYYNKEFYDKDYFPRTALEYLRHYAVHGENASEKVKRQWSFHAVLQKAINQNSHQLYPLFKALWTGENNKTNYIIASRIAFLFNKKGYSQLKEILKGQDFNASTAIGRRIAETLRKIGGSHWKEGKATLLGNLPEDLATVLTTGSADEVYECLSVGLQKDSNAWWLYAAYLLDERTAVRKGLLRALLGTPITRQSLRIFKEIKAVYSDRRDYLVNYLMQERLKGEKLPYKKSSVKKGISLQFGQISRAY